MKSSAEEIIFKNCYLKDINPIKLTLIVPNGSSIPYEMRIHNNTTLFYVAAGEITFQHEKTQYSIHEGQCFLAVPGSLTTLHNVKYTFFKWLALEFSGDFQKNFAALFTEPALDAPKSIFSEIINTCLNSEQPENLGYFLSGQLFRLYYELSARQTNYRYFVKKAKNYIDSNYMENITIEDISKMLNMDRHYISRIFKNEVGLSMKAYMLKVRLEKAAELLKDNYTVYQAVQTVGYSDISNFSHKFKQMFGVSPKDYANKKSVAQTTVQKKPVTERTVDHYNWSPKDWRS